MSFAKFRMVSQSWGSTLCICVALAAQAIFAFACTAADPLHVDAQTRWATYEDAGKSYFALSVQADPNGNYPTPDVIEVAVLVDTSATQTGPVRLESLEIVEELARSLPANAKVHLLACDVDTVALTQTFAAPADGQWQTALAKLRKRIPLGTTNLGKALKTAASKFSDSDALKTIVYVGDGVNRSHFLTSSEHRQLIDELVQREVSVSSLVIGPVVDVATLAAISNHTGGVLFSRGEIQETTQVIGRNLAVSCTLPVVRIHKAELPNALSSYLPQQFPPLRVDRDTVIVGLSESEAQAGEVVLHSENVVVHAKATPESSNPDLGFLALVMESAGKDGGLTMPALGSPGLRAMSFVFADNATSMVKSGRFALKAGEVESALKIAEEALKSDPNNAEAISLLNAAKKLAAGETEIPTGKFMQFGGGDDPFGSDPVGSDDPFGNTTEPGPAEPTIVEPADDSFSVPQADPIISSDPIVSPMIQSTPVQDMPVQGGAILSETFNAGDLLAAERAEREVRGQALEADVRQRLRQAQELMYREPTAVKNSLKLLLEELDSTVDIDATLRSQLRDNVSSAIKMAATAEARVLENLQRGELLKARADQSERILAETNRQDETLKRLVEQFNRLMATQHYREANKDVAPEISRNAPNTPLDNVTREESSLAANYALVREAFEAREQGFVDVMTAVEEAAVPFAGDPPLVYPPPEVWKALTAARKERYGAINLSGGSESETKIYSALKQQTRPDYSGVALRQVLEGLKDELGIPIWLNQPEIDLLGVDVEEPVVLDLPPITVRSALRLILDPLDLTYIIRNEVLEITTKDSAESDPINKVYPVGDLVVPPMPMGGGMMGGMGGMGGGMGGMGGMGGGMGGMGGMGGGMGGMGGGMGGMGGGMGGMFAVPDDASKSTMTSPRSATRGSTVNLPALIKKLEAASEEELVEIDQKVRRFVEDRVAVANAYVEAAELDSAKKEFQKCVDLIGTMLSSGHPQPWMYHALSLSMEACDYSNDEIKRVLLSGLDFEGSTDQSVKIAKYFARKGMKVEALELLRDVAIIEPHRYDAFALALPLARETQDYEALRWVCVGILSKAWPTEHAKLYDEAELLAKVTKLRLAQEGRVIEAKAFEEQIKESQLRDIAVRVTWTGDADLDIRVKEPAGTICSLSNPQTVSGGVLLGDTSSRSEEASIDGFSEFYVCAQGYAGQYDVLIRKVYGEVSGGKVTVEIFTDYGTDEQTYRTKQVELQDNGAVVQVAVKNGHRDAPIAAAHLASVREKQMDAGRAILGQFGGSDSSSAQDYADFRRQLALNARRGFGFPVGGGAVGYRPVITTLPEGMSLFVTGVVSADRRYVRISPSPNFTGIGEIFTFNFVDGGTGTGGAGGGGFGGGGNTGGFGGGGGGGIL